MHERESGHKQTQTRLKRLVGKYKDLTRLLGAEGVGRPRPAQGQDGGGGRHHAGSQRRDAQHRAPGHGQSLPRVPGRAGPGRQVCGADEGDTASLAASLDQADRNLQEVPVEEKTALSEVVTDKGYHSNHTMKTLKEAKIRSYVSEPDRGRRNWKKDAPAKAAVYANRRRLRGERGKRLQRRRAEYAERSFAHTYESGGMRRTHLRGHTNIYKRLCIHGGAFNPGLAMRKLTGSGTPRGFHGLLSGLETLVDQLKRAFHLMVTNYGSLGLLRYHFRTRFYIGECTSHYLSVRPNTPYIWPTPGFWKYPVFSTACSLPRHHAGCGRAVPTDRHLGRQLPFGPPTIRALAERGVDMRRANWIGRTFLHGCAEKGDVAAAL